MLSVLKPVLFDDEEPLDHPPRPRGPQSALRSAKAKAPPSEPPTPSPSILFTEIPRKRDIAQNKHPEFRNWHGHKNAVEQGGRPRNESTKAMTAGFLPPRQTGRADFPHPALAGRYCATRSQVNEPHPLRWQLICPIGSGSRWKQRFLSAIPRSFSRSRASASLEGCMFQYFLSRPWRSRSSRKLYPRKSSGLPSPRRFTTRVFSRLISSASCALLPGRNPREQSRKSDSKN